MENMELSKNEISLYDNYKEKTKYAFSYDSLDFVSDGDIITYLKRNPVINENEMNFSQAMEMLYAGKKVTEINWEIREKIVTDENGKTIVQEPRVTYLKMLRTNENDINENGDNICNQPYIAKYWYNGGYMPSPYSPTQYEFLAGTFKVIE